MTPSQRSSFEQKLEDEYVQGELKWNAKKSDIIKTWCDMLFFYISPTKSVCSHIKKKVRTRLETEGIKGSQADAAVAYIHECLTGDYAKYKDPKFDTSSERRGNPRPSIFEDFDEAARQSLTAEELNERSDAEVYEIIVKQNRLIKGYKTLMSDKLDFNKTYAKRRGIRIPEFETESSDIPPEHFWGQSSLWYDLEGFANEVGKMHKSILDVQQTVYYFRPDPQVSAYCSRKLRDFIANDWANLRLAMMVSIKAIQNILNPVSDGKWGTLLDGWVKIGWDQKVNCGSHGSGVTNSIDTGEYVIKEYRDGRKEIVGLKREFTREQVGDKTNRDLLRLARTALAKDSAQQALSYWIKNTNLVEIVGAGAGAE